MWVIIKLKQQSLDSSNSRAEVLPLASGSCTSIFFGLILNSVIEQRNSPQVAHVDNYCILRQNGHSHMPLRTIFSAGYISFGKEEQHKSQTEFVQVVQNLN
ncbi:hypothetical protein AAZV13_12G071400 [Glycine max]